MAANTRRIGCHLTSSSRSRPIPNKVALLLLTVGKPYRQHSVNKASFIRSKWQAFGPAISFSPAIFAACRGRTCRFSRSMHKSGRRDCHRLAAPRRSDWRRIWPAKCGRRKSKAHIFFLRAFTFLQQAHRLFSCVTENAAVRLGLCNLVHIGEDFGTGTN